MNSKNIKYFSVGICAFNEEKNILRSIKYSLKQTIPDNFKLKEIIIVASGCTDNTVPKIRSVLSKHPKIIKLIEEKNRLGKASAVNKIIQNSKSNLIMLQGADTVPAANCYLNFLNHMNKKNVGMVGGRIVPTDNKGSFLGYANHLKWELHHLINLKYPERPKMGELILFKKIFTRIPPQTAVDEASIEPLIKLQGFNTVYEPKSVVYNSGPKTLREYLSQRRRIFAGHYDTKISYGYEVITFSSFSALPVFISAMGKNPREIVFSILVAVFEIIARFFGYLDIRFKLRSHTVWKTISSSKTIHKFSK